MSAEALVVDERGNPIVGKTSAVPTARELRGRAWRALDGKWGMGAIAATCAFGVYMAVSMFTEVGMGTAQTLGERIAKEGLTPETMAACSSALLVMSLMMLIRQYFKDALFSYGLSAFSVALMRGGATVSHVFSGFGKGWRTVWLSGVCGFFVTMWGLLLIVPGILAALSYSQIYFIRIDRPELTAAQTIAESKRMMRGHRWRYFCLNFSFIGWWLLVVATFGFAALFVVPYFYAAQAAFYEDLLDREEA